MVDLHTMVIEVAMDLTVDTTESGKTNICLQDLLVRHHLLGHLQALILAPTPVHGMILPPQNLKADAIMTNAIQVEL
jgi:hypothetical protein